MLLTAAVSKAEIVTLVDSLTPFRVTIDERRGRSIMLGRPRLELVPQKGIRLRGDARITWDVAGVSVPVTLQAWQILLVPRITTRGQSRILSFEPVIEELDLKRVPGFLNDKIAKAIGDGIAQNRDRIAWDFTRSLAKRWPLPAKIGGGAFGLVADEGAVEVTAEDVKLTLRFKAQIERADERQVAAPRSRRSPMSERQPEIR